MTHDSDGTPQPATQPLSFGEAEALRVRTHDQLMPFLHSDGRWYCYDARIRPLGLQPKVAVTPS